MDTSGGPVTSDGSVPAVDQPGGGVQQPKPVAEPQDIKPQSVRPTVAKEQEVVGGVSPTETHPIVEVGMPKEIPEEVEGWLERVEKDEVAEPPVIVHEGKPLVSPAAPQAVNVTLPLDDTGIKKGLHHKLFESIRWLAEWCIRMAKKYALGRAEKI